MSTASRMTRSRRRQPETSTTVEDKSVGAGSKLPTKEDPIQTQPAFPVSLESLPAEAVPRLPSNLLQEDTKLSLRGHLLLCHKQRLLRSADFISGEASGIRQAVSATLVFAAHQAGTAVCIAPSGLLLTASHCIAETAEELAEAGKQGAWLLFADGTIVKAMPIKWDPRRDLALLRIVAAQSAADGGFGCSFPYCSIASTSPAGLQCLVCIGHPGSEDLEAPVSSINGRLRSTDYDVLCVTRGRFRGLARDQDPQDNSEIGALMHDCWTYWGHSGAPLIIDQAMRRKKEANGEVGRLAGLHSSWDEETGMRRGVPWMAVWNFLNEFQLES